MTAGFYKKANGIIVVYDITREESFENVEGWLDSIAQNAVLGVRKILVGNKTDLDEKREISY